MNLEQVKALRAEIENPVLEAAWEAVSKGEAGLETRKRLEKYFDTKTCLAILDCLSCRHRYARKFFQCRRWLLSREPAEQATDSLISRWRTELLASLGHSEIVELGCGLGGDTVFLSQRFKVTGYERSDWRCELARYNAKELGSASATIKNEDIECEALEGDALFVDPARRQAVRVNDPEQWAPPLTKVVDCFSQQRFQTVGIKCAPGLSGVELPEENSLFFVSIAGHLKEAFVLLNKSTDAKKVAVLLRHETEPRTLTGRGQEIPIAEPLEGLYLHNPDPAILRADALDTLAGRLKAGIVHPKIGYLIGPQPCREGLAASFLILDSMPLKWKMLRKRLNAMGWSEYEYLGRGVPFSQTEVRQRLGRLRQSTSPRRGSLIIYREDEGYTVVLGERHERMG